MELAGYKACICEGSAEHAIIDILLDHELLLFPERKCLKKKLSGAETVKNLKKNI